MKRLMVAVAVALGAWASAQAALELGTPFADGMVLQRGMEVPVWGTAEDAKRPVPEKETAYPDVYMFDGQNLPAWGFYVRHADNVLLDNVTLRQQSDDAREKFVFDDADVTVK